MDNCLIVVLRDLILQSVRSIASFGIKDIEIIVVDDNSPDNTWQIAENTECPEAVIRVIRRMENPGLTNSINDGIQSATKDAIVWLDCDFSHPPEKIPQLIFMLNQGYIALECYDWSKKLEKKYGDKLSLSISTTEFMDWLTYDAY